MGLLRNSCLVQFQVFQGREAAAANILTHGCTAGWSRVRRPQDGETAHRSCTVAAGNFFTSLCCKGALASTIHSGRIRMTTLAHFSSPSHTQGSYPASGLPA